MPTPHAPRAPFTRSLVLAALLALAAPAFAAGEGTRPPAQSFALIGDVPYGLVEEPLLDNLIAEVNASPNVRFVIHSGDVKLGSERCDDALLIKRFNQYQKFADAVIVTPGDNDWTDCHRTSNGNYLPTERLTRFRQIYYPLPGRTSGGTPFAVTPQSWTPGFESYVENVIWSFAGTTMATLHIVGSNNNLAPWNEIDATDTVANPRPDRIAEFRSREAATLAWVDEVFNRAVEKKSAGVLLAIQANPNFDLARTAAGRAGFNSFIDKLAARALAFGKPVLLTHGDSHYFRLDKPLVLPVRGGGSAALENFTRLENFGSPSVHWVEVFVDAADPNVFSVVPRIVKANVYPR